MNTIQKQVIIPVIVFFIFSTPFFFTSCKEEKKPSVNFHYDPDSVPSMRTLFDTMLISDSGIIRYKVISQTWEVYEFAKDPYWYFPDGLYLEQFDSVFNVVTTVKADTAWNYDKRNLWRLKGNVVVRNTLNETFTTEELFWSRDRSRPRIYSDKLITIDRPEKLLLVGVGFESNQQMTDWEILDIQPATKLYMDEDKENEDNDGGEIIE